jgi:3,4-dihydroxy 2-butanone 4-phosphate synthase/GTP cyclohydrolase II
LVGIGTVLSDDPRLNVRLVNGVNPRPVVVDSRLRLPLQCRLLRCGSKPPWIVTRQEPDPQRVQVLEKAGAEVVKVWSKHRDQIDLEAMLYKLAEKGISSLMVEGGARIITSFFMEQLADYIVLTVAPVLVGGLHAVNDLGRSHPHRFLRLQNPGHRKVGRDLIIWGSFSPDAYGRRAPQKPLAL